MKVSAKAEYACIAMLELSSGSNGKHPMRVKSIADAHSIPLRFLVQILLQLKGAGLVASTRGAAGGYQLAKPSERISLADIINVIDRAPNRLDQTGSTSSPTLRALRNVWQEVQAEEQRMLEEITLADLAKQTQHHHELSYQI